MAYDSLVLSAIINELNPLIIGARIEKIYQPAKTETIMLLHTRQGKHRLVLSADARMARVHLTQFHRENPLTPPLFCMVLRKHLEGGRIKGIEHPAFERIVHFYIEGTDELGRVSEKILVCEIMGKHSNIILLDEDKVILDGIVRFTHAVNRHREIFPGRPYVNPPEQGKTDPTKVSEDDFRQLLWGKATAGIPTKVEKWLLNTFIGLSPQSCREIFFRSGIDLNSSIDVLGEYELQKIWAAFSEVIEATKSGKFTPTLVEEGNQCIAFSAIDLFHLGVTEKRYGSMNEIVDLFYHSKQQGYIFAQLRDHLSRVIEDELARNQKKLAHQEDTIAQAREAEEFRVIGEIITANLHLLKNYQSHARLVNFYDPEQKELDVNLDPSLTPAQNAQAYFKKYNKAKAGKNKAELLKEKIMQEINYLESISANLEQANTLEDLEEIKAELVEGGYIKLKLSKQKSPRRKESSRDSQPLQFTTPEGLTIWVGKNNKQNDYLTLKKAKANDLWLHVKDIPGSHVIVRSETGEIPDASLHMAAMLAAYFSKARHSSKVPVDYTKRKNVQKPSGAKPGMVIYENQRTLYVDPPQSLKEIQLMDKTNSIIE